MKGQIYEFGKVVVTYMFVAKKMFSDIICLLILLVARIKKVLLIVIFFNTFFLRCYKRSFTGKNYFTSLKLFHWIMNFLEW